MLREANLRHPRTSFCHRPFGSCPFRSWTRGDNYGWAGDLAVDCRSGLLGPHGTHHLQMVLRPENVLYLSALVLIYHGLNNTLNPVVPAKRELSLQAMEKFLASTGNVPGPDPSFDLVPSLSGRIARRITPGDATIDQSQSADPVRETYRQVERNRSAPGMTKYRCPGNAQMVQQTLPRPTLGIASRSRYSPGWYVRDPAGPVRLPDA